METRGHGCRRWPGLRRRHGPRRGLDQDWEQLQSGPHWHCGPPAQAAWVAAWVADFWQPQVQDVPGQLGQVQGMGCWVSVTVDLLGGSTTGCHRWRDFRRDGPMPTGVCDERSARAPDRSRSSTEWSASRPGPGRCRGGPRFATSTGKVWTGLRTRPRCRRARRSPAMDFGERTTTGRRRHRQPDGEVRPI